MKIMKHLFLLSTVILALNSCKTKTDPNPAQAFDGNYVTITTPPVSFTIKDGKFSFETITICYISGNLDRALIKAFDQNDTVYGLLKLENNILFFSEQSYNTSQAAEAAISPTFVKFAQRV